MNCKPGYLAVIVMNEDGLEGHFVHVEQPYTGKRSRDSGVWWVCSTPSPMRTVDCAEGAGAKVIIHDDALRPIRDPGDDAKDEMLRPLPREVCA